MGPVGHVAQAAAAEAQVRQMENVVEGHPTCRCYGMTSPLVGWQTHAAAVEDGKQKKLPVDIVAGGRIEVHFLVVKTSCSLLLPQCPGIGRTSKICGKVGARG